MSTYLGAVKHGLKEESEAKLILVLLPEMDFTLTTELKRLCCLELGVPSFVVSRQTVSQNTQNYGYAKDVLLKLNSILGGSNWRVHIPMNNCMVLAVNVQDSAKWGEIVVSTVANTDVRLTKWHSQCKITKWAQNWMESGKVFELLCKTAMEKYFESGGILPDRVFVYCVSTTEMFYFSEAVIKTILHSLKSACAKIAENFSFRPAITLVEQQKLKRFCVDMNGVVQPPLPGTVVKEDRDGFLLISSSQQSTPASYRIVHNGSGLNYDQLERFTYKLCHLFCDTEATASLPAPCIYSSKVGKLVAATLGQPAKTTLDDKLYFND